MTADQLEPGDILGARYRIDERVGSGGMSTVYRATDQSLGRSVGLKVFDTRVTDASALARQQSEIRLIASFGHPSLVTLFDAVSAADDEPAYLIMQYVDGADLGVLLRNGALSEIRVTAIASDIANALAYVHAGGVIHRDIKPANILIPSRPAPTAPVAMLADFGIARLLEDDSLTATGSIIGTASYLSPEQALGQPLSAATDVYSLGLVMIEALSGEPPFPGSGIEAVVPRLTRDPELPVGLSSSMSTLLQRMTHRDPLMRISASSVADQLSGREPDETALSPVLEPVTPEPPTGSTTKLLPTSSEQETVLLTAPIASVATRERSRKPAIAGIIIAILFAAGVATAVSVSSNTAQTDSTTPSVPTSSTAPSSTPTATPAVATTPSPTITPSAPVTNPGKGKGHGKDKKG